MREWAAFVAGRFSLRELASRINYLDLRKLFSIERGEVYADHLIYQVMTDEERNRLQADVLRLHQEYSNYGKPVQSWMIERIWAARQAASGTGSDFASGSGVPRDHRQTGHASPSEGIGATGTLQSAGQSMPAPLTHEEFQIVWEGLQVDDVKTLEDLEIYSDISQDRLALVVTDDGTGRLRLKQR